MKEQLILLVLLTVACADSLPTLCDAILNKESCQYGQSDQFDIKCYWTYDDKCEGQSYRNYFTCELFNGNEQQCQAFNKKCVYRSGICIDIKNKDNQCSEFTTIDSCQKTSYREIQVNCDWKHDKCVEVEKCSDVKGIQACRNNSFADRCTMVNYKTREVQSPQFYDTIIDLFSDNLCIPQDCDFPSWGEKCPAYRNGRKCFLKGDQCNNCSNMMNSQDCIGTQACTWQNKKCRDILCSDLSSPNLCGRIHDCSWNSTKMLCLSDSDRSHCQYKSNRISSFQDVEPVIEM